MLAKETTNRELIEMLSEMPADSLVAINCGSCARGEFNGKITVEDKSKSGYIQLNVNQGWKDFRSGSKD